MMGQALEAERRGDYLTAFRDAVIALQHDAGDAPAMALLARLCAAAGDDVAALEFAAGAESRGTSCGALLEDVLERVARPLDDHAVAPGSAGAFRGMDVVERALRRRSDGRSVARLANAAARAERYDEARTLYATAADLLPEDAPVQLAFAELSQMFGEAAAARAAFGRAFTLSRAYPAQPVSGTLRVALLLAMRPWSENAPLDYIIDRTRVTLDRWYLDDRGAPGFDPAAYDAVFNGLGAFEANAGALRWIGSAGLNAVNDPTRVMATARPRLASTLGGIAGVCAVETRRVPRECLPLEALPFLMRPPETHAGRRLAKIDATSELDAYLTTSDEAEFDVCPFVEYASPDGAYRKYRIAIVDGRPYPYHLAISGTWMVHYLSSDMKYRQAYRDEEAAFLERPVSMVRDYQTRFAHIAQRIGLDYVGLDVGVMPDGTMLVFEADPVMLLHAHEPDERFAYRLPFVANITGALTQLLQNRRGTAWK